MCAKSHTLGMPTIQRPLPIHYSIQASLNKYMERYSDYWHSKHMILSIHLTQGIGDRYSLLSLIMCSWYHTSYLFLYKCGFIKVQASLCGRNKSLTVSLLTYSSSGLGGEAAQTSGTPLLAIFSLSLRFLAWISACSFGSIFLLPSPR